MQHLSARTRRLVLAVGLFMTPGAVAACSVDSEDPWAVSSDPPDSSPIVTDGGSRDGDPNRDASGSRAGGDAQPGAQNIDGAQSTDAPYGSDADPEASDDGPEPDGSGEAGTDDGGPADDASPGDDGASDTGTSGPDSGPAVASAIFGGGPFYSGGASVMNDLRASGFTTVILWSIHVNANGDLVLNDKLVASNGAYAGDAAWPGLLATLKQAPTSIDRIEVSIGSAGVPDFERVQSLIASGGTGPDSILYRNFQALRTATHADAADFDDESLYDVNTSVQFGTMLANLGYAITLCPYTNGSVWHDIYVGLGGSVDRVYLQDYAGGGGNDPASWNQTIGTTVIPGLWSLHSGGGDAPNAVQTKMANWRTSAGITSGFMWLYDDIQQYGPSTAAYATAITDALQ